MKPIKLFFNFLVFLILIFSLTIIVAADNIHSDLKWSFTCTTCDENNLVIPQEVLVQNNMDLPYRLIIGTSYENGILCSKITGTVDVFKLREKGYEYIETIKNIDVTYTQGYNSGAVYFNENFDNHLTEGPGKYFLKSTITKEYFTEQYCRLGKVSETTQEDKIYGLFTEENDPTINIISPEPIIYNYQDVGIEIQGTDDSEYVDIFYSIDNTNYNINYNGIITRTFSEGTHTLYAIAVDPSGNTATDEVTFTIESTTEDTTPPKVIIISPVNRAIYNQSLIAVIINATDDESEIDNIWYEVYDINNNVVASGTNENTKYEILIDQLNILTEGEYILIAHANNTFGLEGTNTSLFYVQFTEEDDTTPPIIEIISPEPITYTVSTIDLVINANDDSGEVLVYYAIDQEMDDDYYDHEYLNQILLTFSEGTHTLYAIAVDPSGNTATDEVTFTIESTTEDTTPPNANIVINNNEPTTTSREVLLNLEYSDADSGVDVCRYGQIVETSLFRSSVIGNIIKIVLPFTSKAEMQWTEWQTCTPTKEWVLTEGLGTKTVYYQVIDNAGNIAQAQDSIELIDSGTGDLEVLFTIIPTQGYVPLTVSFSAEVLQGTPTPEGYTYELITGDGEAGELETQNIIFNLNYVYNNVGNYSAILRVCDANTCVERVQEITVYPKQIEEEDEEEIEYHYRGLHIDNIVVEGINSGSEYMNKDDIIRIIIKMTNYGADLEELKVTAVIDDLGLYMPTGRFDLDNDNTIVKIIEVPLIDAIEKMYDIRIVVSNEEVRRIKYRGFKVQ